MAIWIEDHTQMTVGPFVDKSVGHRFVIARSVQGVLKHIPGDGEVLYYGDKYSVPDYLRSHYIINWSGDFTFKDEEYDGSILIIIA